MDLRLVHRCSVCGQEHEPWYRHVREAIGRVRGEDKYNLCSCCGRPPEDPSDAGYRRKWKRWKRQQQARERVDAAFRKYEAEKEEEREAEIARENANEEYGLRIGRS